MRFGRNLHKNQVPLWADYYLDYHGLKNIIKRSPAESVERGEAQDKLDDEIDNVQVHYQDIFARLRDEVKKFNISHNFLQRDSWDGVDRHELRYFLGGFLHYRSELKKLHWYGQVNTSGFKRLLEKLARSRSTKLENLEENLDTAQFSGQTELLRDVQLLQSAIASINVTLSKPSSDLTPSLILDYYFSHSFPSLDLDFAYKAIQRDDVSCLEEFLQDNVDVAAAEHQGVGKLVVVFITLSIICGSADSIVYLLQLLVKTMRRENISNEDYYQLVIMRILVVMGQQKLIINPSDRESMQTNEDLKTLLSRVLSELGSDAQVALLSPDPYFNCVPLQYAAEHGLFDACELLLGHMQDPNNGNFISSSKSIIWQDNLRRSPSRVAIARGDYQISKLLLGFYSRELPSDNGTGRALSGALLADAIKSNTEILSELIVAGANVDHQNPHGETALYIAARSGDEKSVKTLLNHKANVTIAEKVRGWTPLIIASVEGYVRIVQLLAHAGAARDYKDLFGWTAIDHAAFRGHITLVKDLREGQTGSRITSGDVSRGGPAMSRTVKPLRMPLDECLLLVNLGSFDPCKYLGATDSSADLTEDNSAEESKSGISIQFFLIGRPDAGPFVDLPILEETINKPRAFYTKDPNNAKVMFKIFRKATDQHKQVEYVHVGSGIALLKGLKPGLGCDCESLFSDYRIPILATNGLWEIGTVTFSFLLVKPHSQSSSFTYTRNVFGGNGGVTKVVGHRGLGQNFREHKHLSIGENTIQSFFTATDLGADAVEVTRDHIPVVYHDFLVSETGTDAWMHNITLRQFKHITDSQSEPLRSSSEKILASRPRSRSLDTTKDHRIDELTERMKHTFGFKLKGFKANTRGNYIQEPFITLDDLLSKTPASMTLNIEIKYPMLFEAIDDWKSDNIAIEPNLFVDQILSCVLLHPSCRSRPRSRSRSIMFSSFSPEICILLSLKQSTFPVFFLNDSGNGPTGDIRASSLQEAIHFAKKWALDGIVMASEPFVYAPKLVRVAKEKGLVTASYGGLNNEPDCAKIQAAAGLDIIIVDAVRLICETLKTT